MMKVKKFYTGAIYRGLTHEKAKCLCLQNPDMVMTRREWVGYHFIVNNEYFILLKNGQLTHVGDALGDLHDKIWNINDKDWIVAYRSRVGKEVEGKVFQYNK